MACKFSNIIVSPSEMRFEVDEGWGFIPPYQYLRIENEISHDKSPHWEATVDEGWMIMGSSSGSTPVRVRIGCQSIGKPAGVYQGTIRISSHVEVTPSEIPITLTVIPKEEPPVEPDPPEEPKPLPDPPVEPEPDIYVPVPPDPPQFWVVDLYLAMRGLLWRILDWLRSVR